MAAKYSACEALGHITLCRLWTLLWNRLLRMKKEGKRAEGNSALITAI